MKTIAAHDLDVISEPNIYPRIPRWEAVSLGTAVHEVSKLAIKQDEEGKMLDGWSAGGCKLSCIVGALHRGDFAK